jgi:hypothetical protein
MVLLEKKEKKKNRIHHQQLITIPVLSLFSNLLNNVFSIHVKSINPLLSLTLQSARDLNVLCWPKRSKAPLLFYTFKFLLKKRSLSAHALGL